jgi:hypothetical protein
VRTETVSDVSKWLEIGESVSVGRKSLEGNGDSVSEGLCMCRGERRLRFGRQCIVNRERRLYSTAVNA